MDSKQNHGQDSMAVELIQRQAEQVFGNKEKAQVWMSQAKSSLGGVSPLCASRTREGYELVSDELKRFDEGYI